MHTVCLDRTHPRPALAPLREATAFWRDPRFGGMECMSATFITHRFSPHAHEHFGLGVMETGLKLATIRGAKRVCGPGDLYLINPEEVHDGGPVGGVYRYRMIYPSVALVKDLLEEFSDRPQPGAPFFPEQMVSDPALAHAFNHAHCLMENRAGALEEEEGMLVVLAAIFARHSQLRPLVVKIAQDAAVTRARDYLHAHFADDVGLAQLAAEVGTSRTHLIRSFRAAFHITPHAYLTSLRIRAAQKQLSEGVAPIEVAFACGFADQAHFTRSFKARTGMTPAQFRRG